MTGVKAAQDGRGEDGAVEVEVRYYNSMRRYAGGGWRRRVQLPAGATLGDLLARLALPLHELYVVFHNGETAMADPGAVDAIETGRPLADGDVVALSGPVPFSRGYGVPVC
ncbi:MoaD/ThiS family protein [Inmirania thermothiophila]|uniref:Molybdopterin converting factor small subunit n=1 Tax=Inmirania thermothiophila TaxID=1750597 RepID=A0A3N1XSC9_9GAMM|nr:MoaD/ThiS family protein [Inmirania thermothiophila]ROR29545.1 molybdopterin converting factor small subunit [Inmirania thermothiophila]